MKVDASLIIDCAVKYYGVSIERARAEEVATEVEALCRAVRNAGTVLTFDDEPAQFHSELLAWRRE